MTKGEEFEFPLVRRSKRERAQPGRDTACGRVAKNSKMQKCQKTNTDFKTV